MCVCVCVCVWCVCVFAAAKCNVQNAEGRNLRTTSYKIYHCLMLMMQMVWRYKYLISSKWYFTKRPVINYEQSLHIVAQSWIKATSRHLKRIHEGILIHQKCTRFFRQALNVAALLHWVKIVGSNDHISTKQLAFCPLKMNSQNSRDVSYGHLGRSIRKNTS